MVSIVSIYSENKDNNISSKHVDKTFSFNGTPLRVPYAYYLDDGIALDLIMPVYDETIQEYIEELNSKKYAVEYDSFKMPNSPFAGISSEVLIDGKYYRPKSSSVCIKWNSNFNYSCNADYEEILNVWERKYDFIKSNKNTLLLQHVFYKTENQVSLESLISIVLKGAVYTIDANCFLKLNEGIQLIDTCSNIYDNRRKKNIVIYVNEIRFRKLSKRIMEAMKIDADDAYGVTVHYESDEELPMSVTFELPDSQTYLKDRETPIYGSVSDGTGLNGYKRYAVNAGVVNKQSDQMSIILKEVSIKLFDDRKCKLT